MKSRNGYPKSNRFRSVNSDPTSGMKRKEFKTRNLHSEEGGRRQGPSDSLPYEDRKSVNVWKSTWMTVIGQVAMCRCRDILLWITNTRNVKDRGFIGTPIFS